MHIRNLTKQRPAKAYDIQYILDVITQIFDVLSQVQTFFGVDFSTKFQPPT